MDQVQNVTKPGDVEKIERNISIQDLLSGIKHLEQYWMYQGSLTTPPCSNTLTWIISQDIIKINKDQVLFEFFI